MASRLRRANGSPDVKGGAAREVDRPRAASRVPEPLQLTSGELAAQVSFSADAHNEAADLLGAHA
jgi:hypothetical protein